MSAVLHYVVETCNCVCSKLLSVGQNHIKNATNALIMRYMLKKCNFLLFKKMHMFYYVIVKFGLRPMFINTK